MDIHLNELVVENGFNRVYLKDVSFRDIDLEFLIFETENTYGSILKNNLYYCFIKPYEGLHFRLIGQTDWKARVIIVDEDIPESAAQDLLYAEVVDIPFTKIVENGDLISNQQIINVSIDLYENDDLIETRKIEWIDKKRVPGNPDLVEMNVDGNARLLRLKSVSDDCLIAFDDEHNYRIDKRCKVKALD